MFLYFNCLNVASDKKVPITVTLTKDKHNYDVQIKRILNKVYTFKYKIPEKHLRFYDKL